MSITAYPHCIALNRWHNSASSYRQLLTFVDGKRGGPAAGLWLVS